MTELFPSTLGWVPQGRVSAVRGNVVDVRFPMGFLPPLRQALRCGDTNEIVLEVLNHLSAELVRTVALTATRGMVRDMPIQ